MNLKFYPGLEDVDLRCGYDETRGYVGKALKDLSKRYSDVFLRVNVFFNKLENVKKIDEYLKNEEIYQFPGTDLFEMRIPKQRKGGVFRIYFCFSLEDDKSDDLILLDAEMKHKKQPMRLNNAKDKLKEYYKSFGKVARI